MRDLGRRVRTAEHRRQSATFTDPFGLCPVCIVAYGAFELASAAYDVYQTRQAFRRGAGEGAEALQATLIGAIPDPVMPIEAPLEP
jgi:hypothetical protein